ncbi:hypothetical protein Sjap_013536 [Stephania japonica]|uniref:Transmembrane protein n=1 Tax=Stephania japonica TaxID=461633 RepID=A0AAP0IY29_9MAGN
MSALALTSSLPPLNPISITTAKPRNSLNLRFPSLNQTPNPTLSSSHSHGSRRINEIQRVSATTETGLSSEPPLETAQQMIQSNDSAASNFISILLLVAFAGLTILTIGVVYIGVSDFLEKREREKFEKEESEKKSKVKGKRGAVRAKNGPRGFGQKIDEDDDDNGF